MNTSSSEGNFMMASDYHLTLYKVRREIVSSQWYNYASLVFMLWMQLNDCKTDKNGPLGRHSKTKRVKDGSRTIRLN